MKATTVIAVAAALVGAYVAGERLAAARDELTARNAAIGESWSHVDAVLERRAALVPRLVEALQPTAPAPLLAALNDARNEFHQARSTRGRIAASTRLESTLERVHPLLAPPAFVNLRDDLAHSENEIAIERRKYNDAVQKYNTSIELFPNNVAASLFGFARDDAYFQTEPAKRDTP